MKRAKQYQVGHLTDYQENDPVFNEWETAIKYALRDEVRLLEYPSGIWSGQDEGGELLAIVYQGEIFEK